MDFFVDGTGLDVCAGHDGAVAVGAPESGDGAFSPFEDGGDGGCGGGGGGCGEGESAGAQGEEEDAGDVHFFFGLARFGEGNGYDWWVLVIVFLGGFRIPDSKE